MQPGLQPGMQPGLQPGVQFMPVILPADQAMRLAQNGGVVPVGQMPMQMGPQMQGLMLQQHQSGKGFGSGSSMSGYHDSHSKNQHSHSKGGKGGSQGGSSGSGQIDDWLSKRFAGSGKSETTSAAPRQSDQQASKAQQHQQQGSSHSQQHPQAFVQQPMMQQQQLGGQQQQLAMQQHQQHMQQMQQQFQQRVQQQQQQWMWQMQQEQQQQWHYEDKSFKSSKGKGKGKSKRDESPRTAAWREAMSKATSDFIPDVDEWASRRSAALASGPAFRAKSGAEFDAERKDEEPIKPAVDFQEMAKVFADDRAWADIADEQNTANEILRLAKIAEERQASEEPPSTSEDVHEPQESSDTQQVELPRKAETAASESQTTQQTELPTSSDQPVAEAPSTSAENPAQAKTAPKSWATVAKAKPANKSLPRPAQSPPAAASTASAQGQKPLSEPTNAGEIKAAPKPAKSQTPAVAAPDVAKEQKVLPEPPSAGEAAPKPVTTSEPEQTAASAAGVEKRKKALLKKLRQIKELEEKQESGVVLDADQAQKVASRAALEAELEQLE